MLAGMSQRQTDSQMGFVRAALVMSIYHLFSLRINWRVYDMTDPTISENIIRLCHCIISHNCYHSIDAFRINLSKICYNLDLWAYFDEHRIAPIGHSSTDRKIAGDNCCYSNNHLDCSYNLNFDIANFSVYDDHNYFDTELHSYQATNVAGFDDYHCVGHHGNY